MSGLSEGIERIALDVNSEESVREGVERIVEIGAGRIDVLINNAGQGCVGPMAEVSMERMRETFNVNVFGLVAMVQAVAPHMIKHRSGTIVNIGSIVAYVPTPWAGVYCASKAAVHSLSDVMRMELKGFGLNVVCVAPGAIKSSIGASNDKKALLKTDSVYSNLEASVRARGSWSQNPSSTPAEVLASSIADAALAANPPRYLNAGYRSTSAVLSYYLPTWLKEYFWGTQFGINEVGKEKQNKSWTEALALYTKSLELDSESESAAAVYSNRSASKTSIFQYDEALIDAGRAIRLRPTWSKGYARKAEAYGHLHAFHSGIAAYEQAISRAEDDATKARYEAALKRLTKRSEHDPRHVGYHTVSQGEDIWPNKLAAEKAAGLVIAPGSYLELLEHAYSNSQEGLHEVDENVEIMPGNAGIKSFLSHAYANIVEAILSERRGLVLFPGKDPKLPLLEKMKLQFIFELECHQSKKWADGTIPAEEFIDEIDRRRLAKGWGRGEPGSARKMVGDLVRGLIIMAFLEQTTGNFGGAVIKFRYCLGICEAGEARWPNVGYDDKGSIFRLSFRRAVKALLLSALETGHAHATTESARRAFKVEDIEKLSQELIDECHSNMAYPMIAIGQHSVMHTGYQITPLHQALLARAYAYKVRSTEKENLEKGLEGARAFLPNVKMSRKAADCFDEAVKIMPNDDPDYGQVQYHALMYRLRCGGLSIRQIFKRAAKAEEALTIGEHIFGPNKGDFEARTFSRLQCDGLRDFLDNLGDALPLSTIIKPIPTIYLKNRQDKGGITDEFWLQFKGDMGLVDARSADQATGGSA
ncbi:NAD(P)-binding protein [Pseudohyphozyma bogoriensis]|nr:NAD(P)-binding protein [Pseudohyphozyma bogoriensis]